MTQHLGAVSGVHNYCIKFIKGQMLFLGERDIATHPDLTDVMGYYR
jgi:hypothetical protein